MMAWALEAAAAGLSAGEIRAGREPLVARRAEIERLIADETLIVYRTEGDRHFADIAATASKRKVARASRTATDPRADLEMKLDHVIVRPVGRNKWVDLSERIEIKWRDETAA